MEESEFDRLFADYSAKLNWIRSSYPKMDVILLLGTGMWMAIGVALAIFTTNGWWYQLSFAAPLAWLMISYFLVRSAAGEAEDLMIHDVTMFDEGNAWQLWLDQSGVFYARAFTRLAALPIFTCLASIIPVIKVFSRLCGDVTTAGRAAEVVFMSGLLPSPVLLYCAKRNEEKASRRFSLQVSRANEESRD